MEFTIQNALAIFYKDNNFGEDGGVTKKVAWIKFGFFSVPIPNAESRKKNVCFHDIGHLLTGYDTTWKGESAAASWEIASGGWGNFVFPWLLTLWAMGLGVVFYPKEVYRAFILGSSTRNPLGSNLKIEELLKMTVSDLRMHLNRKEQNNKSMVFWFSISFLVFATPFFLGAVLAFEWWCFLQIKTLNSTIGYDAASELFDCIRQ